MIGIALLLLALIVTLSAWLAHSTAASRRQEQREIELATRGECCQGRILAVQRPFLLESTTRLYFEFAPPGWKTKVQCCHTERRLPERIDTLLPSVGMYVTVRYLPENPQEALIGKLLCIPQMANS